MNALLVIYYNIDNLMKINVSVWMDILIMVSTKNAKFAIILGNNNNLINN